MTEPREPIEPAIADLLALFEGPLRAVSFPEVDRETLASLAENVRQCALEVAHAKAALEATEALLDEQRRALLVRAKRALAYARVFGAEDAELTRTLDHIVLPAGARQPPMSSVDGEPKNKRRGRPRKATGAPLFGAAEDLSAAE